MYPVSMVMEVSVEFRLWEMFSQVTIYFSFYTLARHTCVLLVIIIVNVTLAPSIFIINCKCIHFQNKNLSLL